MSSDVMLDILRKIKQDQFWGLQTRARLIQLFLHICTPTEKDTSTHTHSHSPESPASVQTLGENSASRTASGRPRRWFSPFYRRQRETATKRITCKLYMQHGRIPASGSTTDFQTDSLVPCGIIVLFISYEFLKDFLNF